MNNLKNGQPLNTLTPNQLHNAIVDAMSEIILITGAKSHDGPMLGAQVETIKRFLWSGFSTLTQKEIVFAFHLNLQGCYDEVYRHYSRELNCEFIGDVLRSYLKFRLQIAKSKGKEIQNLLNPAKPVIFKNDVDYDFWKKVIQTEYEAYRNGFHTMGIWCSRKYYPDRKHGQIPFDGLQTWFKIMRYAMSKATGGMNLPAGANLKDYSFSTVNQVKQIFKTEVDFKICLDFARKSAYYHVFKLCMEGGINNLFEDISPLEGLKWPTGAYCKNELA